MDLSSIVASLATDASDATVNRAGAHVRYSANDPGVKSPGSKTIPLG